jgi:hypothetical protein
MGPDRANVIPFPLSSRQEGAEDEAEDLAPYLVSAILRLGEPATAAEIWNDLARLGIGPAAWTLGEVCDLLRAYSDQGPERVADQCLFQQVMLGDEEAWAFTPALRQPLRESGLTSPLRKAP